MSPLKRILKGGEGPCNRTTYSCPREVQYPNGLTTGIDLDDPIAEVTLEMQQDIPHPNIVRYGYHPRSRQDTQGIGLRRRVEAETVLGQGPRQPRRLEPPLLPIPPRLLRVLVQGLSTAHC